MIRKPSWKGCSSSLCYGMGRVYPICTSCKEALVDFGNFYLRFVGNLRKHLQDQCLYPTYWLVKQTDYCENMVDNDKRNNSWNYCTISSFIRFTASFSSFQNKFNNNRFRFTHRSLYSCVFFISWFYCHSSYISIVLNLWFSDNDIKGYHYIPIIDAALKPHNFWVRNAHVRIKSVTDICIKHVEIPILSSQHFWRHWRTSTESTEPYK